MSLPSPCRFLIDYKDGEVELAHEIQDGWIKSKVLYAAFKDWCSEHCDKIVSCTVFGKIVSGYMEKKKSSCIYYDIGNLKEII